MRRSLLALTLCLLACPTPPAPRQPPARLQHDRLQLELDANMVPRLLLAGQPPIATTSPLVALVVDGKRWDRYSVEQTRVAPIRTALGQGRRLVLRARAEHDGRRLALRLVLDAHRRHPRTLFARVTVTNPGPRAVKVDRLELARLSLPPGETWALQGAAVAWGHDAVFALRPGYHCRNSLAARRTLGGGGLPLNDLWTQRQGVALGHAETLPWPVAVPISVSPEGRAATWVEQQGRLLRPGEQLQSVRTFIHLHAGDFHDALTAYRRILADQGLTMARPPATAFEPIWCSWGYEFDMRPEEIEGVLPKLQELGIGWAVVDDRWFDAYGDWQPRPEIYGAGGEKLRGVVRAIHDRGLRARLWWIPLAVELEGGSYESHRYRTASIVRQHPDWLILDRGGRPVRGPRDLGYLCPALPQVQQHHHELARRFVADWGFDGHKLDVLYATPPCHNPAHRHGRPEESSEALAAVVRIIHETTRGLKPDSVTEVCPCGTTPHFVWLPHLDQVVTADPVGALQVRRRVKLLKALMGSRFAVYADHVELTRVEADEKETGRDFASALGTGAVIGTKFTWPGPTRSLKQGTLRQLDPDSERHWKRWLSLARRKPLARGEYLNLYDLAFDRPETHVVRQGGRLHYAFYARGSFSGRVTFRGAWQGCQEVFDYVERRVLGRVDPTRRSLAVRFSGSLLVELRPCS